MIYDVIGDIHGYCDELITLLDTLGYRTSAGAYRHADAARSAVFVGDLIDRGPQNREVVALVKAMCSEGAARIVMGNHEYNAVCYATPDGKGGYLREHNEKNRNQHRATLEQFEGHSAEWSDVLAWFRSLPLFLDLGGLRVVHAAWSDQHIAHLKQLLGAGAKFDDDTLRRSSRRPGPDFDAVEVTMKGPEIRLPDGHAFKDKDGHDRHEIRVAWWKKLAGNPYVDAMFPPPKPEDPRPDALVPPAAVPSGSHCEDSVPVIFGHYWLRGDAKVVQTPTKACVDCSVAKGGALAAYTWRGEDTLVEANVTRVPARPKR